MSLNFFGFEDISKKNNTEFKDSVLKQIQILTEQLESAKKLLNFRPEWSAPAPINKIKIKTNALGVYKIIHKPSNQVMSIGQGIVSSRRGRHLSVLRNNGQDVVSEKGHVSPSQTGKKMYIFDSDENNWYFTYCLVPNKHVCEEYEAQLQISENPVFNNLSMAGK